MPSPARPFPLGHLDTLTVVVRVVGACRRTSKVQIFKKPRYNFWGWAVVSPGCLACPVVMGKYIVSKLYDFKKNVYKFFSGGG